MNERIKKLLEEATEVYDYWHRGESVCMVNHKMFAELIIQECVSICKEKERANLYGIREVEATIKEHFGVKL